MKIRGMLQEKNGETTETEWTIPEINRMIENGYYGMVMFQQFLETYTINGHGYHASSLTIGGETTLKEEDGKLIVSTFFKRNMLAGSDENKDPDGIVKVDAVVNEQPLLIIMTKP